MSTKLTLGVSPDVPSFFEFSRRGRRGSTDSGGTSVSPMTEASPTRKPMRSRPPLSGHARSRSDYGSYHSRVKVQTIEEDAPTQPPSPLSPDLSTIRVRPKVQRPPMSQDSVSQTSVARARITSLSTPSLRGLTQNQSLSTAEAKSATNDSPDPAGQAKTGKTWSRTPSGATWSERKRSDNTSVRNTNKSSQSSGGSKRARRHTPPIPSPKPLRPPLQRNTSGPSYHHAIKMETSFHDLRPKSSIEVPLPDSKLMSSRRTSIRAKGLLSAPLTFIRTLSRRKSSAKSYSGELSAHTGAEPADHDTSEKHVKTSAALRRVSSVLYGIAGNNAASLPTEPGGRYMSNQAMSDQSVSSKGSRSTSNRRTATGLVSAQTLYSRKSWNISAISVTSSFRRLKAGKTPHPTPEEAATYKVKRSPSAETEEYLKIDISVRGGTSYLPSEARRIHTPPLPSEGPLGQKRGFFFDYNAPLDQGKDEIVEDGAWVVVRNPDGSKSSIRRSNSRATTVDRKYLGKRKDKFGRVYIRADWYDTQLAEFDTDSEDELDEKGLFDEDAKQGSGNKVEIGLNGRIWGQKNLGHLENCEIREDEEAIDWNIPEHLPNSPLCPRHPRYWRVLEGTGSQYRRCWMHGVGLDWSMGRR